MDIGRIYGTYSPSTTGRTATARSTKSRDFFYGNDDLLTNRTRAYPKSSRPKLTDSEIRSLSGKYDFRNMTQESYDSFLDDLVQRGVLTRAETSYFGYGGEVRLESIDSRLPVMRIAGLDERYSQNTPFLEDGVSGSGDMVAWLAQMMVGCDGGDGTREGAARARQRMEMYGALIDVVYRATGTSVEGTLRAHYDQFTVTADYADDIVGQIRDPNSDFYRDMFNRMRVKLEESEEEKEKQAIIDALDAILESLSARKDEYPRKKTTVRSMAELSQVADSLDKDDPRKAQLNLLRERLQQLGIYADLDVGVKDEDESWETLTESLIREETEEPNLSDII